MRRALVAVAIVALAAPASAGAHLRTGRSAVDFRGTVLPSSAPLRARVYLADLALRLELAGSHRVIVLGYLGEPFIRLDPSGVFVNLASPTAAGTKLASPHPRSSRPLWHQDWNHPIAIWHDARVRAAEKSGRWRIPLLVDGRRTSLAGTVERVDAPAWWPWVAIGVAFAVATALGLRRPAFWATALGVLAGAATLLGATGFAVASTGTQGAWIEAANEAAFALAAAVVVVRGSSNTQALAGGFLGLLGLAAGLTKLPVLGHGIVLSALPGNLERLAVVLAIAAGAGAAMLGLVVFFDVLENYEEPELPTSAERSSAAR
jgi:hypothetical protein